MSGNLSTWYSVIDVDGKRPPKKMKGNEKLSEHFQVWEFACSSGCDIVLYSSKNVINLERLRLECGNVPLYIGSACRNPSFNDSLDGSAFESEHQFGRALDINFPIGITPAEFELAIFSVWGEHIGFHRYMVDGFCHIDSRGYKERW